MTKATEPAVIVNPWQDLRRFTSARIALGRTGVSLPTAVQLDFQLAHARARDAVHQSLDAEALTKTLRESIPLSSCMSLSSAAETRNIYLQRPDFGRRLSPASRQSLEALTPLQRGHPATETDLSQRLYDIAFVIADGLSALAIEQNAAPFLKALLEQLKVENWSIAPFTIVRQGRVAIGDEIGELLGAKVVVVLVGERPGLSSPGSMGLYLTWGPRVGLTDDSRNCISNIRPAGLPYPDAAYKLHYLLSETFKRSLSGVRLKDETAVDCTSRLEQRNFLLAKR